MKKKHSKRIKQCVCVFTLESEVQYDLDLSN